MSNARKGEVDLILFEDDPNLERRHYTLRFSNVSHIEMENLLNLEQSEILARINTGRIGPRLITAMFYGATRKFHRREFPTTGEVDDLMDEIADEAEDPDKETERLAITLMAAYTKVAPDELAALMGGEEPKRDSHRFAAPKDQDKPTRKPKQKAAKKTT